MATKKFKVGDTVRVIQKNYEHEGKRAVVTSIDNDVDHYPIGVDYGVDDGGLDWLDEDELVLVSTRKKKKTKIGQAYRGNGKHMWERVTDGTARLRVPGGWLYKTIDTAGKLLITRAVTFVPMPEVVRQAKHAV